MVEVVRILLEGETETDMLSGSASNFTVGVELGSMSLYVQNQIPDLNNTDLIFQSS